MHRLGGAPDVVRVGRRAARGPEIADQFSPRGRRAPDDPLDGNHRANVTNPRAIWEQLRIKELERGALRPSTSRFFEHFISKSSFSSQLNEAASGVDHILFVARRHLLLRTAPIPSRGGLRADAGPDMVVERLDPSRALTLAFRSP